METTWDGAPISQEKPHGAAVLVYRRLGDRLEFLILHRTYEGPDYEGEWAWTPPSGARLPGEPVDHCAKRELQEETGLDLAVSRTDYGSEEWWVFTAEAPAEAAVRLSVEHDRWLWLSAEKAGAKCRPAAVGDPFLRAAAALGS